MALDTRDRRASAIHVGMPWRGLLPLPDAGAEDQGDRQHLAFHYRGILAANLAALPRALRTYVEFVTSETVVDFVTARTTVDFVTGKTFVEFEE